MQLKYLFISRDDLRTEFQQLNDEGRDISDVILKSFEMLDRPAMEEDPSYQNRAQALLDQAAGLPYLADYAYDEPSELERIREVRPKGPRRYDKRLSEADLHEHMLGAWLGRCSGCLLGKPVEGWMSTDMWPFLKALDAYPLRDYFRSDVPESLAGQAAKLRPATIDRVDHMPEDDDTNYTVTGLAIMERNGPDFAPAQVAEFWLANLPILHTFTAERIAYRNLTNLIPPPFSATYRNPYREWIGAQIRADFWGYVALGNPELAAEYAWRDASISHVRNGIYGEMWVAAMLAAAPFVRNVREVIQVGLSEIPAACRLAKGIHQVIEWHESGMDWERAITEVHRAWDETQRHHWCHTISNAQIVALGLLWGENDFEKSICRAVQACFDTDCNGATVGSIFGMMHGASAVPEKWAGPLNDRLDTGIAGYYSVRISDMVQKSIALGKALA